MKKKNFIWVALLIISMLICIAATIYIVTYFFSDNDNSDYLIEPTTVSAEAETTLPAEYAENHNINWKKLKEDNSDIYAWIYIPDTKVDYAVVQPGKKVSDNFYLNRNIKKNYEFAGSIYSQKNNSKDFMDPVTVLYGHNMLNDSMFATLHNFEDQTFFKKHKYMYIYTPKHRLTYKIYAAYVYDDRHILNSFDFSDETVLKKYFKYTQNPDTVTKNTRKVNLTTDSKVLTLSTCTSGAANTRYLVQGVLIKDEETN